MEKSLNQVATKTLFYQVSSYRKLIAVIFAMSLHKDKLEFFKKKRYLKLTTEDALSKLTPSAVHLHY
jgi:hypothetical protein